MRQDNVPRFPGIILVRVVLYWYCTLDYWY